MAAQATELLFLEHLAGRFNLPVPEHLTAEAGGAEIREAIKRWKGKALVKPDILGGRRGKAGMVRLVSDYVEAQRELKRMQGLEVHGQIPRTSYMVQYIPEVLELYAAITYDSRWLGPSMTVSLAGGVDVEEVEEGNKETVPVDESQHRGRIQHQPT